MRKISDVDSNFKIEKIIQKTGMKFFNADDPIIGLYGVFKEGGKYRRLPEVVAKTVNEGVHVLHANTAGGRIRFKTDSGRVGLFVKYGNIGKMAHFAFTGSAGFDLYVDNIYRKTFIPPLETESEYEGVVDLFEEEKVKDITINFPLYSEVCELYIGIDDGAVLEKADEYSIKKPVVYYGSSITQGGCASRPGNSYESIVSRKLDCDYINLGFSGSACGEDEIANYIKNLDMSVFVYDYDHNAPSFEHLEKTHERMYRIIREANPELPVIFMSRPKMYYLSEDEMRQLELIKNNYEKALANGENVYFISGKELMGNTDNDGTVDNCHPNDIGFKAMAEKISEILKRILGETI